MAGDRRYCCKKCLFSILLKNYIFLQMCSRKKIENQTTSKNLFIMQKIMTYMFFHGNYPLPIEIKSVGGGRGRGQRGRPSSHTDILHCCPSPFLPMALICWTPPHPMKFLDPAVGSSNKSHHCPYSWVDCKMV